MEIVIILAIAVLVLVGGVLMARKGFERGTMPTRPEEDERSPEAVGPDVGGEAASADPRAMGRPSDRG
jgi:hypothetical protein